MSVDEYVDVVDPQDRVVATVPRSNLKHEVHNYRVVHVLVLNERGEVLLQKLARRGPFEWGSSVAGHVQAGESYERAAEREFGEELGVRAPALRFVGKAWLDEGGRRKFIGVFTGQAEGPFSADASEVEAVEFVPVPLVRRWLRSGERSFSPTFERVFRLVDSEGAWLG